MVNKVIAVSRFQGNIEWSKVKADDVAWAFSRLGEGATYTDPTFVANFKNAKLAGINAGGWHIFRARSSKPEEQAQTIIRLLNEAGFTCQDGFAFEVYNRRGDNKVATREEMSDNLFALISLILESGLPMSKDQLYIKTNIDTWKNSVDWERHSDFFKSIHLWTEEWRTSPDYPQTLLPWGENKWRFWEYTANGKINGISNAVLLSKVNE